MILLIHRDVNDIDIVHAIMCRHFSGKLREMGNMLKQTGDSSKFVINVPMNRIAVILLKHI